MKRILGILSISLLFILACGLFPGPATPVPPTPLPPAPTVVPATATVAAPTPGPALGTIALDFVALLCDAQWMNGAVHLQPCPPEYSDHSGGWAVAVEPAAERLPAGTPALLTFAGTSSAALFLRYPTFEVHPGDRFRATLRCQTGAPCDVEFALEYYDAQGAYHSPFLQWSYKASDPAIEVDADLGALQGQSVDFVLALRPQHDTPAQKDGGLWIAPYIYRPNP